jgi:hypothetical protein
VIDLVHVQIRISLEAPGTLLPREPLPPTPTSSPARSTSEPTRYVPKRLDEYQTIFDVEGC